jgi:hypothetical protein
MFADHPDEAPQAAKRFRAGDATTLLIKVVWEIRQLRRSFDVEPPIAWTHAPAYHAFNCAVTCWHLSNWTWEAVDEQTKQIISEQVGARLQTLEDFQAALRTKHRVLHICWQIADGSKHFRLRRLTSIFKRRKFGSIGLRWQVQCKPASRLAPTDIVLC